MAGNVISMSFYNIARVFAYPVSALILLAYGIVGYAVYAHVNHTWLSDDPRMLIPGTGFLAIIPGVVLLAFSIAYRQRMPKFEFCALTTVAVLGVLLLPGVFGAALLFDW